MKSGKGRQKTSSFTVIELIMVLVIIGILSVLAIPRFESYYFIKLSGASKKLVSDIRYTQQLAVSRHEDYEMVFNAGADTYLVRRVSDSVYATDPFTRANMIINFGSDIQYSGIDISNPSFGGTSTLRFDWRGVPMDGSGTALASDGQVSLSYKGNTITVYVEPNTGWVRIP